MRDHDWDCRCGAHNEFYRETCQQCGLPFEEGMVILPTRREQLGPPSAVVITGVEMPFGELFKFASKVIFAMAPAQLAVGCLIAILFYMIGGFMFALR